MFGVYNYNISRFLITCQHLISVVISSCFIFTSTIIYEAYLTIYEFISTNYTSQ